MLKCVLRHPTTRKEQVMTLSEYGRTFAICGACTCGKCCDSGAEPDKHQPNGHAADVYYFQVAASPKVDTIMLRQLIAEHKGVHCECDPLDGNEHGYIELGGWIGDQRLSLMLMGLGAICGLWQMMTPKMLPELDKALMDAMAGGGMISIVRRQSVDGE